MPQKDRSANYSKAEEDFFLQCLLPYKNIIECKRTNTVTNKRKEDAWLNISDTFNANSPAGIFRNTKQLQQKYKNILKGLRRQNLDPKHELMVTDGVNGTPASDLSATMAELAEYCSVSIKGLRSTNKDDAITENNLFDPRTAEIEFLDGNSVDPQRFNQQTNCALEKNFQSTNDSESGLPFRTSVCAMDRRNLKSALVRKKTRQESASGKDMFSAKNKYFVEENERARERHKAFMAEHKLRLEALALVVEEKHLRNKMKRNAM